MHAILDHRVREEMARAWADSLSDDPINRHEEGGYIIRYPDGVLTVERWPRGEQARIIPPPMESNNRYNGDEVVAAFHTHPNPPVDELGQIWNPAPSPADLRWHVRHRLTGFVIADEFVYEIDNNAGVKVVGPRVSVL